MSEPTYQYWVEFIDGDTQKSVYLQGENVAQIKAMMSDYKIVVIDNTETSEPCYWAEVPETEVAS